jgi:uncharacterized membrane protein
MSILFKILKVFGIDLPARMAEVRVNFEERFDLAKNSVEQTAQALVLLAALFFLVGLAALSAFGVGLVALYSWVSTNYGPFYGFAILGGILLLIAIITFATAMSKAKSWRDEHARNVAAKKRDLAEIHPERVAAAAEALEGPATRPLPPPESSGAIHGGDLIEPAALALSSVIKLPPMGNPAMDELLARLRISARRVADETVSALVRAIHQGGRAQLFAALGGAALLGLFLGRYSQHKTRDA